MIRISKFLTILLLLVFGSLFNGNAQTRLKIMDLNVFSFEPDFNTTPWAEFFKEQNPDIICLNEVENRSSRQMKNGKYRDLVYEIGDYLNMFSLYGFSYSTNNKTESHPIEQDKYVKYEMYGNAILSRYPIINSTQYLLPRPKGSADRRSVVIADILLPSGVIIRVACTHLDHIGGQKEQQEFLNNLKELNTDMPTILAGDFNSDIWNAGLQDKYDTLHKDWVDHILGNKTYWKKISEKTHSRIYNKTALSDLHNPQEVVVECLKF